MLATVLSGALLGIEAYLVKVEVDVASRGLPKFTIVGLPEEAVRESRERIRSALANTGFTFPMRRITVNLAPAYLTSGLFAFLASMDNYPISIFLTDARNKTLPIKMLQYLEEQPDPSLAAMSSWRSSRERWVSRTF